MKPLSIRLTGEIQRSAAFARLENLPIDAVRAEFGECKVSYASENGITKGAMWPDAAASELRAAVRVDRLGVKS